MIFVGFQGDKAVLTDTSSGQAVQINKADILEAAGKLGMAAVCLDPEMEITLEAVTKKIEEELNA